MKLDYSYVVIVVMEVKQMKIKINGSQTILNKKEGQRIGNMKPRFVNIKLDEGEVMYTGVATLRA
jgi:hypothetical protein